MPPKKAKKAAAKGKGGKQPQQRQEDEAPESPESPISPTGDDTAGDATVDATTAEIAAAEAAAEAAAAAAIEQAAAEEAALEAAALAGSTTQEQITDSNTPKKSPTALGLDLNNTPGGYAAGIPLPITPRPEEAPPNLTITSPTSPSKSLLSPKLSHVAPLQTHSRNGTPKPASRVPSREPSPQRQVHSSSPTQSQKAAPPIDLSKKPARGQAISSQPSTPRADRPASFAELYDQVTSSAIPGATTSQRGAKKPTTTTPPAAAKASPASPATPATPWGAKKTGAPASPLATTSPRGAENGHTDDLWEQNGVDALEASPTAEEIAAYTNDFAADGDFFASARAKTQKPEQQLGLTEQDLEDSPGEIPDEEPEAPPPPPAAATAKVDAKSKDKKKKKKDAAAPVASIAAPVPVPAPSPSHARELESSLQSPNPARAAASSPPSPIGGSKARDAPLAPTAHQKAPPMPVPVHFHESEVPPPFPEPFSKSRAAPTSASDPPPKSKAAPPPVPNPLAKPKTAPSPDGSLAYKSTPLLDARQKPKAPDPSRKPKGLAPNIPQDPSLLMTSATRDTKRSSTAHKGGPPSPGATRSPGYKHKSDEPGTPRGPSDPIYRFGDRDAGNAKGILESMRSTVTTLDAMFNQLQEQSNRVASLGPTADSAAQIQTMRRRVRAQDRKQEVRIDEVKRIVREVLKDQIAESMRAQIEEQIRTELAVQVRAQVALQLAERGIPPSTLHEQAAESKRQLAEVRCSLVNSEARRANSVLRAHNLDEPLAQVLRASDGRASELFPTNLKHLFGYDAASASKLASDYDIPVVEQRERNLNKFMAHIGLNFNLVPVGLPGSDSGVTGALSITA